MKRRYAKAYLFMGLADILGGVFFVAYSVLILLNPSKYINESGQRKRWGAAFDFICKIHLKGTKLFLRQ